ncbi:MAG: site-specific integrase [Amedibacillus dolichus]|uniref:Site-specific integrase n=2 Tax=Amedibacillus dolichus TaxID=31971 RepID=A0A943A232_9FIRM|nr:site-specific integrase [Amedibacillus dolichus]EDP10898.1 site-specific recombinase, phage integrase family [Amedibacillus dolichus DSM 3991]MBS4883210.1 site-specific integrase [Amedibacillus dolichus]
MAVKKDERMVKSKKRKDKLVKKITYKCEGSYIDANGSQKRYHKRGFATADEAKEWERVFLLESTTGVSSNMTVNDLYIKFMDQKKLVIRERTFYQTDLSFKKHILPVLGNIKLSNLTLEKIEKYQHDLLTVNKQNGEVLKNSTLELIQKELKSLLAFAYEKSYIKNMHILSFKKVINIDESKKEVDFWQPEEFYKFIEVVDDIVYLTLFNVLYWCGLRIGEALALNWNDIDFNKKTIRINKSYSDYKHRITNPKTQNSYRTVIMPDKCFDAVSKLFEHDKQIIGFDNQKYIFHFEKPLNQDTIKIRKDRWIAKAHVKRIRIHDLRHSHVSLLINLGFSAFDIAKRLGHSVDMVNNVYGHWFQNAQNKMVDKLNNM